jgi:sec-independent protein translocase protein TatA
LESERGALRRFDVLALFQDIGIPEVIIILAVALLLFGAKRLPEIGKGLGKGLREFKDATKGLADDVKAGVKDEPSPAAAKTEASTKDAAES